MPLKGAKTSSKGYIVRIYSGAERFLLGIDQGCLYLVSSIEYRTDKDPF
jgi:hypothetical protein